MDIRFTHQGYDVIYADNRDVWLCHRLAIESKSPKAIVAKINKIVAETLKAKEIYALDARWSSMVPDKVRVISRDPSGDFWILTQDGTRRKVTAANLIALDTEVSALLDEFQNLEDKINVLRRKSRAVVDKICERRGNMVDSLTNLHLTATTNDD